MPHRHLSSTWLQELTLWVRFYLMAILNFLMMPFIMLFMVSWS